jgi:soluble P-type ATPase
MNLNLELASAEDLLRELAKRYKALVVVGAHIEDTDDLTTVFVGPAYMCMGLVIQTGLELMAGLNQPQAPDQGE